MALDPKHCIRQRRYDSKPENKARKAIKAHERYLRTRDQQIAYGKEYRAANADWRNQKERDKRRHLRMEILLAYGARCVCCAEWRYEFLTMHHIDNDGAQHRRDIKYGNLYEWIKTHDLPSNFSVLCWNCNLSLGKYERCPHVP